MKHDLQSVSAPDARLGILLMDLNLARVPGCMASPKSFAGSVMHKTVRGSSVPTSKEDVERLIPSYVEAAGQLQADGAKVITDNCNGLMAMMQAPLSSALEIPVITSALFMVPQVSSMLGGRRVGIMTFFEDFVDERLMASCGWSPDDVPIAVAGVGHSPAWLQFLKTKIIDDDLRSRMVADMVEAVRGLKHRYSDLGAIICECTLLPPCSQQLRAQIDMPVYDNLNLLDFMRTGYGREVVGPGAARFRNTGGINDG